VSSQAKKYGPIHTEACSQCLTGEPENLAHLAAAIDDPTDFVETGELSELLLKLAEESGIGQGHTAHIGDRSQKPDFVLIPVLVGISFAKQEKGQALSLVDKGHNQFPGKETDQPGLQ